jgi:hypothetical protein
VHDGAQSDPESGTEPSSGVSGDAEPSPSETIDSIIDQVQTMTPEAVLAELDRLDEEPPSGADEAELRRTLAVRLSRDAGLL